MKIETGGHAIGDHGYFVEPTVLTKTNRDMKVVREEIFSPVVCVQSFDDDDLDESPNSPMTPNRTSGQYGPKI